MVSSPRARANEVLMNGSLTQIPGLAASGKPLLANVQSGSLDCVNAVTAQGHWMAPCDCTVVGATARVLAVMGTAAATIGAGLTSDTDSIVDDYSIGTGIAAGTVIDLPLAAGVNLNKGDVVVFQSDGGATSTGSVAMSLAVVAR